MAIRILINTDSAVLHSGLAETTRNIFLPLLKQFPGKYEIHQKGWWHRDTGVPQYWPIYPTEVINSPKGPQHNPEDTYGRKSLLPLIDKLQPDIVFAYGDLWTFDFILDAPSRDKFKIVVYYTVDGLPYYGHLNADGTTHWGRLLSKADKIVTLSHFGRDILRASCPEIANEDISVCSHPINMELFQSLPPKEKCREALLPPAVRDATIFGWLGRNQFRKQNYKLWEFLHYMVHGDYIICDDCGRVTLKEWNLCRRRTKDPSTGSEDDRLFTYEEGYDYSYCYKCRSKKIRPGTPRNDFYMWFHMPKDDSGYNPELHGRAWDVDGRCIYTNDVSGLKGVPIQDIPKIIRCWDALFYPTGGEGLGNPVHEALACEVPVLYSDYSSHAENARHGGLPIKGSFVSEMNNCIQRMAIHVDDAVRVALKFLAMSEEERKEMGKRGREYISSFSMEHMVHVWDSILTEVAARDKQDLLTFIDV